MSAAPGTHRCPGPRCQLQVSDTVFCCPDHWWSLPARARKLISRTAGQTLLSRERQVAITFARRCWELGL